MRTQRQAYPPTPLCSRKYSSGPQKSRRPYTAPDNSSLPRVLSPFEFLISFILGLLVACFVIYLFEGLVGSSDIFLQKKVDGSWVKYSDIANSLHETIYFGGVSA